MRKNFQNIIKILFNTNNKNNDKKKLKTILHPKETDKCHDNHLTFLNRFLNHLNQVEFFQHYRLQQP